MIDLTRPEITVDTETTGLNTVRGEGFIHCASFVNDEHSYTVVGTELVVLEVNSLVCKGCNLVFHNAAYDVPTLRAFGADIPDDRYICTMVGAHKINPQLPSIGLDYLAKEWLNTEGKVKYGELMAAQGLWSGKKGDEAALWRIPFNPTMRDYCLEDTRLAWELRKLQLKHFEADPRLAESYYGIHLPFIEVIISLQNGLVVDQALALSTLTDMVTAAEEAQSNFLKEHPTVLKLKWCKTTQQWVPKVPHQLVEFNPSSPNDVASLMAQHGFISDEFTPSGRPQYSQAVLKRKAGSPDTNPQLANLCAQLADINSVNGIVNQLLSIVSKTQFTSVGCYTLFGSWHQCGAVTHRMASSNPNMQNLSVRHPVWGAKVRSVFVPPPGYTMLVGDLSQIELAILAYYLELLCSHSSMAQGFRDGVDAHDNNTVNWYGLAPGDDGFKQQRAKAKNGAFATNYGAFAKRLSLTLSISVVEAQDILDTVNENIPVAELKSKLWGLMQNSRDIYPIPHQRKGRTNGVFYDCLNTRCFYPGITSSDRRTKASEQRKSFNALCQSGCFSIMAKLLVESLPTVQSVGGWFAGVVHDEALVYVPLEHADTVLQKLNTVFNSMVLPTEQGGVPVRADFHIIKSWADK